MLAINAGNGKPAARRKVDVDRQGSGLCLEVNAGHKPRRFNSQGSLKKLFSHGIQYQ